MFVKSG
ncbi:hypothetical protein D043_1446A, partial [Vibrio parahaemolyticus EKP-021]